MFRILLATVVLALPMTAGAQLGRDLETWRWDGRVTAGQWLRVFNVNGSVAVGQSRDDQVHVIARKQFPRGSDPRDVSFSLVQKNGNVTICAISTEDSTCDEDSYSSNNSGGSETRVSVYFEIQLPRGVKSGTTTVNGGVKVRDASDETHARTVNGDVEITSLRGRVKASSVNGSVNVVAGNGPVDASTVNGSVKAAVRSVSGSEDMSFTTTNGSVVVELPASLDADVSLNTVIGRINSDYPLTITGRFGPRRARGTIGRGGRRIRASTVNGSVTLRKAP